MDVVAISEKGLAKDRNRELKSSFSEHPGERVQGDFGVAGHTWFPSRLTGQPILR